MVETKFKNTDIGMIPVDWEIKKVGEIADNYTGLTYHPEDIRDYGTLVLRSSNIQHDALAFDDNVFVEMDIPERAIAKEGDILICVRNGSSALIGKSAMITPEADGMAFGAFMTILRTSSVNNKFLLYAWQNRKTQDQIRETFGATINQITAKDFNRILLAVPTTTLEQTCIAETLTSIDKLISELGKLIVKKKDIKQGTMQQLLSGKKRLKGFSEPWVEKKMWEVTTWDKRFSGVPSYMQSKSIKYPYVLANVFDRLETSGGNVLLLSTGNYVGWTTEEKAGQNLCEGEIVAIPWGGKANVKYAKGKFVTADNRIATSSDSSILNNKFLYYLMLYREKEIDALYRGASIKHPSMLDVLSMTLNLPSVKEQSSIANVLSSMDDEIASLEAKRNKYIAIKQGMMQQLLTGKIRLI